MRILVTGCQGMLGSRLTELLVDDYEVYGCDLKKTSPEVNISYQTIDLRKKSLVRKYINSLKPDVIFHLAAKTQVDDCEFKKKEAWDANVLVTQNLLNASKKFNPLFFYISTDYVFSGKGKKPYKPNDKISPPSVYGQTKSEGEKLVRRFSKKGVIVRTAWLYGADGPNFVDSILNAAKEREELQVVNDQIGCPTYTCDLADTLLEMLKKAFILPTIPTGIYHFTGAGSTTWCGFAKQIIKKSMIKKVKVKPITSEDLNRPAPRPSYSILDMQSLQNKWGIHPRDWKESLDNFLRAKGVLHEG